MEQVICGASAFELYRIPPQVTLLLPEFPHFSTRRQRSAISRSNDLGPWLNLPIHTLCDSPSARTRSSAIKDHVWSGDLPSSAIWENNEVGVRYTSPLMTLLTLAPLVSVHRLTMAAYELCGSFAVYAPGKEMQCELDRLRNQRLVWPGGWRQVYDHAGKPTSLWHRDPLVTLHELRGFCEESKGMHGHRRLCQAARAVTGVAASPLEVQASMLLNLTRRRRTGVHSQQPPHSAGPRRPHPRRPINLLRRHPVPRKHHPSGNRYRASGPYGSRRRPSRWDRLQPHARPQAHGRRGHHGDSRATL